MFDVPQPVSAATLTFMVEVERPDPLMMAPISALN
jgi:hypothetical protein